MLLNCGVGEESWASLGWQGDLTRPSWRRTVLGVHWKDWCWSWNSNTLATWCEELTHLKRPWSWERLRPGGERDNRGWDGWMASVTQWTSIWVDSRSWWWTRKPGVLQFIGSQRVKHDWVTELNSLWGLCFYLVYGFLFYAKALSLIRSYFLLLFTSIILGDGSKSTLLWLMSNNVKLAMFSPRGIEFLDLHLSV